MSTASMAPPAWLMPWPIQPMGNVATTQKTTEEITDARIGSDKAKRKRKRAGARNSQIILSTGGWTRKQLDRDRRGKHVKS